VLIFISDLTFICLSPHWEFAFVSQELNRKNEGNNKIIR